MYGEINKDFAATPTPESLFDLTFDSVDDFWTAEGPVNLANLGSGNNNRVDFSFGLSIANNDALVPIVEDGVTPALAAAYFGPGPVYGSYDVVGFGSVTPNPTGNLPISDTDVFFVAAPVPEAASIACWVGLSVAGLFGARRFRG